MFTTKINTLLTQNAKWVELLTAAVFIMSVFDGVMTLVWVLLDHAEEANPLMDVLLHAHPALFMLVKIILVALGTALLWRHRFRPLAIVGVGLCFIVYSVILSVHLSAVTTVLRAFILNTYS